MRALRALLCAVSFLTRLPVRSRDADPALLGTSLVFFPVVGLLLGAILLAGERVLHGHLSTGLTAVVLVTTLALLTGGLHLDGVSDVFDGLGGGRGDRDRALAIMRDSRIGAFGALAMLLVVLAKVVATRDVLDAGSGAVPALCVFPVVARLAAVVLLVSFPYARPEGLGRAFHEHGRPLHLVLALALAAPIVAWSGVPGVVAAVVALAAALAFAGWVSHRLGGITGDVCGAAIELSEVACLVAFAWQR